ncbi:syntaxin-6-like [Gigantopelta aegis]|uniref:syntaxin-6-like n=1 Tax=Gigantopelta aegis TaxID=1735272 RepID=UPI001B88BD2D|nr:syntaxin-6-like [Gigantopelta aegis]
MSLEDPFFVVKDEVERALSSARGLFNRWKELQSAPNLVSHEELDWTTNELRNSLRSIEWDLEDLEETVSIVEKNPRKFKIDEMAVQERRGFIDRTKSKVREMKDQLSSPTSKPRESGDARQSLLSSNGPKYPQDRYTRLDSEMERSNQRYIDDTRQQQQLVMHSQDDTLEQISSSVGVLKNMSQQIGSELEEQNVMLDEFHHELDSTDSRMDTTMKKMAKVLHMSNDRRQWCAIFVLILILVIVIILFFVL